jgi:hypothetical protein
MHRSDAEAGNLPLFEKKNIPTLINTLGARHGQLGLEAFPILASYSFGDQLTATYPLHPIHVAFENGYFFRFLWFEDVALVVFQFGDALFDIVHRPVAFSFPRSLLPFCE